MHPRSAAKLIIFTHSGSSRSKTLEIYPWLHKTTRRATSIFHERLSFLWLWRLLICQRSHTAGKCIFSSYLNNVEPISPSNLLARARQLICENEPLKPVIALIHPGGYKWGSPDPDHNGSPDYLMHQDIVYVTIGHRLGALGNYLNILYWTRMGI